MQHKDQPGLTVPTVDETAVIVPIPQAEAAVASWRSRLDPAAGWGVPAHVTVLYPFVPPDSLDDTVLARVAAAVLTVASFDVTFAHVRWFDDRVIWLAPQPDGPFRALTDAVCKEFPDTPPYGGAFADVVPHLTVGDSGAPDDMRAAAESLAVELPIYARIDAVRVMRGSSGRSSWRSIAELPLGR